MVTNKTYEYGVKYLVHKAKDKYLLIPVSLEGGLSDGFVFSTGSANIPICNDVKDLRNKYVMDNVYTTEDLEETYEYEEDTDFLSSYFYDDYKDVLFLVEVDEKTKKLKKYRIDLKAFMEREYDCTYFMDKKHPAVLLNEDFINDLLQSDNIKLALQRYRSHLASFKKFNRNNGITKIDLTNGEIVSVESEKKIVTPEVITKKDDEEEPKAFGGVEVSYKGLRDAIKERVFGHDEEIDTIAQKLYLNYTAEEGESVESILIVGPTGTGKTETVRAASEYLYIPYFEANASNLVPQGIKGISIEDVIIGLYEEAGRDLKRAERGIVFLDEFDKVTDTDLDIKLVIKNILLSFNDGSRIPIGNDNYDFVFNSKMTNKVYAGVFERISEAQKTLGFGADNQPKPLGNDEDIRAKIIEKGYYSLEDLSRINTILGYDELSREIKKQILLSSKLSEFAKKKNRYKRQFGVDLQVTDDYIEAILDSISNDSRGMRSVNNFVKRSINPAERALLESERKGYKRLVLTKETVQDPSKFDIS